MTSTRVDTNPRIDIDVSDSYFNEKSQMLDDEYYKDVDDRINIKMADAMKKVAALVVTKFDSLL